MEDNIILKEILERLRNYKTSNIWDGLDVNLINEYSKNIKEQFGVELPLEIKQFLSVYSCYCFGSGINLLGKSNESYLDLISKTQRFKDYMKDWEIGQINEQFIVVATYHDGEGFIFYYGKTKKYIVADYVQDYELDNINSLVSKSDFSEVLLYLEEMDKENFK